MSLDELLVRQLTDRRRKDRKRSDRVESYNKILRRRLSEIVTSLGVSMPGSPFREPRPSNKVALLAPGEYGGSTLRRPNSEVHALSPGTFMRRRLLIESDAVIDGMTLAARDGADCVSISSPAVVLFRGCTFERPDDIATSLVTVATGAKAVFVGCVFRGGATTALPVVAHGGAAANVQIAFSYNKTGNTLFTAGTATGTGNV